MKKADSQNGYQHLLFIRFVIYVYNIPYYLFIVNSFFTKKNNQADKIYITRLV